MTHEQFRKDKKEIYDSIETSLKSSLDNLGIRYVIEQAYEYSAIKVSNTYPYSEDLYFWIKLNYNYINDMDCTVGVILSNIQIPPEFRRKGLFTDIVNKLKTKKKVRGIMIESVLTEEMVNWCKKHRFCLIGNDPLNVNYVWNRNN